MFDHLDDPDPHSLGTDHQLAAARTRGRELARHTRRNRLAVGSAAVAATAGITAVAVVGLPRQSVAGTAADSSASPYPSPLASSSPTPAPVPASSVAVSPVPLPVPASSVAPYPSPSVAAPVPARSTASPVPIEASPTPIAAPATPTAATATPDPAVSVSPTAAPTPSPTAADCASVTSDLRSSVLPDGFTPLVPPSGVISWAHPGAPIKALVVTVSCAPFDPSQVATDIPVKEVTVLGAHSWLIGDPASGKLQLTWNATASTAVTIAAQITLPELTGQVEDQLLTLGNYLND